MTSFFNGFCEFAIGGVDSGQAFIGGGATDEFKISFRIEKSLNDIPNKGIIKIHNLSRPTISKFRERYQQCSLSFGWSGSEIIKNKTSSLIFSGNIRELSTIKEGTDFVTIIEAGDGERDHKRARISKRAKPEEKVDKVIKDISSEMKYVKIGEIEGLQDKKLGKNGRFLYGNARDELNELAEEFNFTWSIQDQVLEVIARDKSLKASPTVLSAATGLVGMPILKKEGEVEIVSLLNPNLKIGRNISLATLSPDFFGGGIYRIESLIHSGDTKIGKFLTTITAKEV